ncbi:restriction endonuclease subunit S [Slackia piriformis]|uniref:restriction endonuclease subunit S n=1 Tax=Slackia piriformis TaxID=626934 RepID=UPI0032C05C82
MVAMKDSSIEWIGIIPEEWSVGRISYRYNLALGKMIEPDAGDSERAQYPYLCAANIKWNGVDTSINKKMYFSASERLQYDVKRGDLLITEGGSVGTSCIYDEEFGPVCYMQNSVIRARSRNSNQNVFLRYWLEFVCNSGYLDALCNKATISHYTKDKVSKTPLVLIGDSETKAIANKLDEDCAEIEALASTIEKQITILERYRASVIHEAVTRGINPNAPFKASHFNWISEIPENWEIKRFKYVGAVAANLVDPSDYPNLIEIDPENIESGTGKLMNVATVAEVGAISAKQLYRKGQIIYSKIRPALNKVVIAPEDGLCSADMYPIETSSDVRWLRYAMSSDLFVQQTSLISNRVAMPKINVDQMGTIAIPVPPSDEQRKIADYLDARTSAIDAVLDTKRKQLDVLKRRRQSLIYEYVTGKRRATEEA